MYEKLLVLETAKVDFNEQSLLILNMAIGFIMVGVAMGLKLDNFYKLLNAPKPFIVGLVSQFVVLPLVTFIVVIVLPLPNSVALGMILVGACPGGNVSNFMSAYSKSNVELSVSLTMFATIAAWILTPLNFAFYGNWFLRISERRHHNLAPVEIDLFQMLQTITYILLIPMIIGMFISYKFPKFSENSAKTIRRISMVVYVIIIAMAIIRNAQQIMAYLHLVFLLVLIHSTLAFISGNYFARIFKLNLRDRQTVTIETGIQNAGLAIALIFNPKLFGGAGGMASVAAWWGVWTILSGLLVAMYFNFKNRPK
jgi:BASS family bile acid:Na+ symporter